MHAILKPVHLLVAAILICAFAPGCSPISSTYETAATIPKGKGEFQGNATYYRFSEAEYGERDSRTANTNLGVRVGFGTSKNTDLKMRYEHLILNAPDELFYSNIHYLSIEPKVCFDKKRTVALKVPVGVYFDKKLEYRRWVVSPQLLITPIRKTRFDLTFASKLDVWLKSDPEDSENIVGLTLGAGFGREVAKCAIRPEIGLLLNPGDNGMVMTYGIGFTTLFGGK